MKLTIPMFMFALLNICLLVVQSAYAVEIQPNIIILLADDLGYGELGRRNNPCGTAACLEGVDMPWKYAPRFETLLAERHHFRLPVAERVNGLLGLRLVRVPRKP